MSDEKELDLLLFKAKLAEQTERYEEMMKLMEEMVKQTKKVGMPTEARNLLSVAYRKVIGSKRAAWKTISHLENKAETGEGGTDTNLTVIKDYRIQIENELDETCKHILHVLDTYLLSSDKNLDTESKVFYYKMKGDYCRYMAEYKTGEARNGTADQAFEAYKEAQRLATAGDNMGLCITNSIRLGLALNYSVFHYEILNNPDEACKITQKAFDDAICHLDKLNDDSYKDSISVMQLLRDNLTLWTLKCNTEMDKLKTGKETNSLRQSV